MSRTSLSALLRTVASVSKDESVLTEDGTKMEMHEVIRQRRSELGMSQGDLAAKVGVDRRQIRRYESGETQPTLSPAQLIEKQLTLFGSFVFPIDRYEEILGFVLKEKVPIEATITHRVSLDDALEVFPAFDRGETGKVVFTWEDATVT